jgi:CRP-like cAMP-binding protein
LTAFGELAVLEGVPRSATAEAVEREQPRRLAGG